MRIGIDVGGTKIEGIALAADGRELARHRERTPTVYDEVLRAIAGVVARAGGERRRRAGSATVGVGTPGVLHPSRGVMLNSNLACLNDRPLDRDLAAALGRPVRLANDGKCFVLSEAIDGAAAPPADLDRSRPDVVFGATLGTGVGGGIVVDGRVLTGENGAATEWSHTTLPFLRPGEHAPYVCVCGHADCIESFTSGRGLIGRYRALGGDDVDGARDRPARSGRRRRRRAGVRRLRRGAGARAGGRRQHARPARDRAGRRRLEQRSHLHQRPGAVGALDGAEGSAHQAGARGARRRQRRPRRGAALAAADLTERRPPNASLRLRNRLDGAINAEYSASGP